MPAFRLAGPALGAAQVVIRVLVDRLIPSGDGIRSGGRTVARQFGASLDAITALAADAGTVVRDPRLAILVDALGRRANFNRIKLMKVKCITTKMTYLKCSWDCWAGNGTRNCPPCWGTGCCRGNCASPRRTRPHLQFKQPHKMDSFLCIINRRMRMRTLAKGSQEGLLLRRPESRFASASVPSVHVVAFRIGLAQMTGPGAVSTLGALVNVQLAGGALETAATGALVGSDAQAAILTRLVADGCNQRERIVGVI